MNPNGSSNFCTAVRGRQIMAARAAAQDAENAAYNEAAVATGAAIGYLNCNARNYEELLVARRDMVNSALPPLHQPRVQRLFIDNGNKKIKKRLEEHARNMGNSLGYYVVFTDQPHL